MQKISGVSKPHLYLAPPQIEIPRKYYLAQKVTERTLTIVVEMKRALT